MVRPGAFFAISFWITRAPLSVPDLFWWSPFSRFSPSKICCGTFDSFHLGRLYYSLSNCCVTDFRRATAVVQDMTYVPVLTLISVLNFAVSDFDVEHRLGPSWSGTSFANICPERRFVRDGTFSGGQLFRGAGITLVDGEDYFLNCHGSRRGIMSIDGSTFSQGNATITAAPQTRSHVIFMAWRRLGAYAATDSSSFSGCLS